MIKFFQIIFFSFILNAFAKGPIPTRIIPLAPSLAEIVSEILAGDLSRIVGVTDYADFPPELKTKPNIGSFHRPNIEKILSLNPDLVIATKDGNPKDVILRLQKLKVTTVVVDTRTIDQISKSIFEIGTHLGEIKRATEIQRKFDETLMEFKKKAKDRKQKPKVLLQIGRNPLIVAGGDSYLNEIITLIGATNIYADVKTSYPRPSLEDVLSRRPDIILVLSMVQKKDSLKTETEWWKKISRTNKLAQFHVKIIDGAFLLRPSPRILQGISQLEERIFSLE